MSVDAPCRPRLDEQAMARLEQALASRVAAGRGMSLDMAHGFLTAVVSGPRLILSLEWLPLIIGSAADAPDRAELEQLLTALYQDVLHELDHGHYGVLVAHRPQHSGPALPLPFGWCRGYAMGLNLHGEAAIDAAGEDPQAKAHLETIARVLAPEEGERFPSTTPALERRVAAELAEAATGLYGWWRGAAAPLS